MKPYDCMDAGGRAMQEQLTSNRKVQCRRIHGDMEEGKASNQ
jgi:hypothetical protein